MTVAEAVELEAGGRRVRLTHPRKLLWPDTHPASQGGITKREFARYLLEVAPALLPHLEGRPLSLTRYPDGIEGKAFYQKRTPETAPAWLERFPVADEEGGLIPYLVARSPSDLAWLAQVAALEIHPWLSRTTAPDHPDRLVFDLDPDPPSGLEESRRVAQVVRRGLQELGLRGYPKYSGASGIHVYLALVPGRYTYRTTRRFVEELGRLVARLAPDRVTQERLVRRRAGRVYVDHLQNLKGKTIVAPYAPRPLPGAPVSTPVTWEELAQPGHRPLYLREMPARLAGTGDLFAPLLSEPASLDEALRLLAPDALPEREEAPARV
ncbi:non-homologous end-joining DNA ligase [Limnochorda pilosa]|uniref:DNA polymerase n=1 Tax=Limnochorda pilosa TaxID=1555112 RepID=A0A0K2SMK4_LIMPI|nr:non-homologous end-joining DNA ligase [Limnochorda pilosa]BAS28346.1 DNA polymerase [Limnochorda pilosa]